MTTIYHNPRCMKSRETLALLEERNEDIRIIEYLKDIPKKEDLVKIIEMLRISPEKLIRKGEPDYKEHFKGKNLSDAQWIDAMLAYPKLIERPIVIKGTRAALGRPPHQVLEIL